MQGFKLKCRLQNSQHAWAPEESICFTFWECLGHCSKAYSPRESCLKSCLLDYRQHLTWSNWTKWTATIRCFKHSAQFYLFYLLFVNHNLRMIKLQKYEHIYLYSFIIHTQKFKAKLFQMDSDTSFTMYINLSNMLFDNDFHCNSTQKSWSQPRVKNCVRESLAAKVSTKTTNSWWWDYFLDLEVGRRVSRI